MLTPIRLAVIAAVLALGSGAVLLSVGQVPSPVTSPAAIPSASPELTTEVVAPGVERVLADAAGHDLSDPLVHQVAVGPDGSVWMLSLDGLFRLGHPGTFPDADGGGSDPTGDIGYGPGSLLVAGDGSVWATRAHVTAMLSSFDGASWTDHRVVGYGWPLVTRLPSGSILATWGLDEFDFDDLGRRPPVVGRFDGTAWSLEEQASAPEAIWGAFGGYSSRGIAVTDDGALWTSSVQRLPGSLWRYSDGAWAEIDAPFTPQSLAAGPAETLWIASHIRLDAGQPPGPFQLARYDGSDWTVWSAPATFAPAIVYQDANFLPLVVAPDGSAWLRTANPDWRPGADEGFHTWEAGGRCDGVGRFDGSTWRTWLPGTCVVDIEPAPDGSAWVTTDLPENAVYRIRP